MGETTVPRKPYYRIGEACRAVDIQPYVLRYWETEFEALSRGVSKSGQRVYTEPELGVIRRIKELLYEEGYTIAGAKKRLQAELEDGRAFGVTDVEGGLSDVEEVVGDEPPTIHVGRDEASPAPPVPTDQREIEGSVAAVRADAETADIDAGAARRSNAPEETPTPSAAGAEPREAAAPAQTGEPVEPQKTASAPTRRPRRRPRRAPVADAAIEASVVVSQPPPVVDSALSQRVETLEHGLRRVLDEVRHLRELLADPSADG